MLKAHIFTLKLKNTYKMDEEKPIIIVRSAIWRWCHKQGLNMSGLMPKELNDVVLELLRKAVLRAKKNKRKTIMEQDV